MSELSRKTDPQLIFDLLLHGLRVNDARLNAVAAEFVVRQGNRAAGRLVAEVHSHRNPPGYRVRLLAVLKRIALTQGLDILDVMNLTLLKQSRSKPAREAAERFFELADPSADAV